MTGHALTQVLYEQALKEGVEFLEEWYAVSLIKDNGRCRGVVAIDLASGKMELLSAKSVVLATGGIRRLYEPSTSSRLCTADGISLAYRAGAKLVDMEMVQYHPSVMKNGRLALSELLFAEGVELLKADQQPLAVPSGQPWAHALARAATEEIAAGHGEDGHLLLKAGVSPEAADSTFFMTKARLKMFLKVDLGKDQVPVAPAMHRLLGGIATDARGATSLGGLFAAGECAGNGFHGAGALDGNGLLASVISGRRAGEAAVEAMKDAQQGEPPRSLLTEQEDARRSLMGRDATDSTAAIRQELAALMHRRVGLVRDAAGLEEASQRTAELRNSYFRIGLKNKSADFNFEMLHSYETCALLDTAEVIVAAAAARQESRGVHHRSDFPARNDGEWSRRLVVERVNGSPRVGDYSGPASR
jgi:succinate dehydrogenase / fumarate reductase flavoprotein subunit